jgi:uncharacterized protein YeaO (DUF488 family)
MGLLKSVNDVPGIDYHDYRDDTYYGKYQYRLRVTVPGIRYAWYSDIEKLKKRLTDKGQKFFRLRADEKQDIIDNLPKIEAVINFKDSNKKVKDFTLRCEGDTAAVFGNDPQKLRDLVTQFGGDIQHDLTEVVTSSITGTKYFVNEPKYGYRVYLKSKRAPEGFKEELKKFLKTNSKLLTPSPAMRNWISEKYVNSYWWNNYMSSYFFIDYNDESTLSYLALMYGEMLGKRYKLEKRPDPV